jgi:hypothetical protein
LFGYILGNVADLIDDQNAQASVRNTKMDALSSYLSTRNVPHELKLEIRQVGKRKRREERRPRALVANVGLSWPPLVTHRARTRALSPLSRAVSRSVALAGRGPAGWGGGWGGGRGG